MLLALLAAVLGCSAAGSSQGRPDAGPAASTDAGCRRHDVLAAPLARLERHQNAVVGVYAVDTGTGQELAYRADRRFAFASTLKAISAGVVLRDATQRELSRRLRWSAAELVPHSPVTARHVRDGLTLRQVLAAAVTVSDNTAANLLLDLVGGPRALDRALESVGDATTVVARREPELNDYRPGDVRDTTTPRAIATSLAAFAVGDALEAPDRRLLTGLLRRSTTGADLIRAAAPSTWRVGDKTGTAAYGTRNDIAVLTPPGRPPIVLAVLTRHRTPGARPDDRLVARAARDALASLCSHQGIVPASSK